MFVSYLSYDEELCVCTQLSKRDIQLVDRSGKVVNLTLWGAEAEGFNGSSCPVIAVKGCKVSDFGGRSLSTQFSSLLSIDPDIPEAHQLRGWFDSVGRSKEVSSISDQRTGGGGGKELNECGTTSNIYTPFPPLPPPPPPSCPVFRSGSISYHRAGEGAGPRPRREARLLQLQEYHNLLQEGQLSV